MCPHATCFGIWSAVLAVNRLRVPSAFTIAPPYSGPAIECAVGLPM